MISHAHRCIFVEVPKTGSTSIRNILGEPPRAHLNIWQIRQTMKASWTHYGGVGNAIIGCAYRTLPEQRRSNIGKRQFKNYFKFGFVRNPWDRVVSLYKRTEGLQMRDKMNFAEFVNWIQYSSSTCLNPVPHRYQLDWFVDPHGNILVDFIGKYENLSEDWAHVARKIGVPEELPHVNANPDRKHYTEYYTDQTKQIIGDRFRVDIEHFEYEFKP